MLNVHKPALLLALLSLAGALAASDFDSDFKTVVSSGEIRTVESGGVVASSAGRSVLFFPSASDPLGRQGFVRVVNQSNLGGSVSITAFDDAGQEHGPITLTLDALQTLHFNSGDFEDGNAAKGLPTGVGRPSQGDWRLELTSDLDVKVLSYIRTSDGFVTSMHDVAPSSANVHRIAFFNPGSNWRQESLLRVVNAGGSTASVTVAGVDDRGVVAPGGSVHFSVPAQAAFTASAADLEDGAMGLSGSLGDGTGKWRLEVQADVPVHVMSLLATPTGHLTNLSTDPEGDAGGGQTIAFGVGDTISSLPTGLWTPDSASGGSFGSSGDKVTIELNNGGYLEEDGYRYTCQNVDGCRIENRSVVSGTIIRTSKEQTTVTIPDANLRAAVTMALGKTDDAPITRAEMASLTSLEAGQAGVGSLIGLETAINLARLDAWGNHISDISPLAGLVKLQTLWLEQNNVTDISPLSALTNLRQLSVGNANIADLSVLSHLTNLTELKIFTANVSSLSLLSGLTDLTSLTLSHNRISDLSPLRGLRNLTNLWLYENNVKDISPLSSLTSLERLSIALNDVSDISALSRLTNLTELRLGNNNISEISPLAGLTELTQLGLGFNNVADISALSGLTNLIELDLSINKIEDVSALAGLTSLRKLDLRGNLISASSIADHVPTLRNNGTEVLFDVFGKGDFDIELVLLADFTEVQQRALKYVARRWMAAIVGDLRHIEFSDGWSGMCAGHRYEIAPGERIDDLRIYVATIDPKVGILGHGGPDLMRDETHLPVLGCMAFDLTHANLLTTGLHEIGHVLGFASEVWSEFGYHQNPPDGHSHFTGPLATVAFDDAGGREYEGAKVPLQSGGGSHWRLPVLEGELMAPSGGGTLSAITIQSLADLGYRVDPTQADAYSLPSAVSAKASAATGTPLLSCGPESGAEPIRVIDQQGRVVRTVGD